ncbi:unnamed protein product [Macrosiphum euphorbiae]|uniref:Uncharacterized protein n=1 Tax=Macrosiphum euphorbiae TaxID=13131 RepID=A0AAV0W6S0_9HEMI|nr:unnamed protein product [Macrosiphum euphorbiae]
MSDYGYSTYGYSTYGHSDGSGVYKKRVCGHEPVINPTGIIRAAAWMLDNRTIAWWSLGNALLRPWKTPYGLAFVPRIWVVIRPARN